MSLLMSKAKPHSVDVNALILPLRELCGLTQEQFAAKIGVTVVTVNRWENYRTKPMPLALQQLRTLLVEMSQSEVEADQKIADRLLAQYFPKDK
jgi:DNA-binding transcriptional regulator YiaG